MISAPLIKIVCSSNSVEFNSPEEIRRKTYENLCSHSLYALARLGDVPPNRKDAFQGDFHLSCASASLHSISKRRSEDIDHAAHISSKKPRLFSICMPSGDPDTDQLTPISDQVFNVGTPIQAVAHDLRMPSKYNPRIQHEINAFVVSMLSS